MFALVEVVDGVARVVEGNGVVVEDEARGTKVVIEGGGRVTDMIATFNVLSQAC